jgi:hypothetical protein
VTPEQRLRATLIASPVTDPSCGHPLPSRPTPRRQPAGSTRTRWMSRGRRRAVAQRTAAAKRIATPRAAIESRPRRRPRRCGPTARGNRARERGSAATNARAGGAQRGVATQPPVLRAGGWGNSGAPPKRASDQTHNTRKRRSSCRCACCGLIPSPRS